MTAGFELIALRCPDCSGNMSGEPDGVFVYCNHCGGGFEVDEEQRLNKIPVYFANYGKGGGIFRPFWAFDSTINLLERETKGSLRALFGSSKGLLKLYEERGAIRFY